MNDMSAFRTPPQKERAAAKELRRDGIKAYVPMQETERRTGHHTKKTIKVKTPIAPGYVFASQTSHRAKYVRNKIGAVSTTELNRLYKARRKAKEAPPKHWQVGDTVKVKVGPYADLTGKIIQDRGRAVVIEHESGKTIAVSVYHLTRPHE